MVTQKQILELLELEADRLFDMSETMNDKSLIDIYLYEHALLRHMIRKIEKMESEK